MLGMVSWMQFVLLNKSNLRKWIEQYLQKFQKRKKKPSFALLALVCLALGTKEKTNHALGSEEDSLLLVQ